MRTSALSGTLMLGLLCVGLLSVHAQDENVTKDLTVCIVNGDKILESDVNNQLDMMIQRMASMGQQMPPSMIPMFKPTLFTQAVDAIIVTTLLEAEAEKSGLKIEQSVLDAEWETLIQRFGGEEQLLSILKMQKMEKKDVLESISKQMQIQDVLTKAAKDASEPTQEEIDAFFEENKAKLPTKEEAQVQASHILLMTENMDDAKKAEARKKIDEIKADLDAKKISFADAAKEHSEGPSNVKGGDLGFFAKGDMVPEFDKVVFALKKDEMSDIVETKFGYHIILKTDEKAAREIPVDEVKTKTIKPYLQQQSDSQVQQAFFKELKENADIKQLMTQEQWQEKYAPAAPASAPQENGNRIKIDPAMLDQN